ncbi:hypothetical protein S3E15_00339 [Bacillus mycoides]|uniref:Uncharacterized protein n=1 Tax=Bacillus mycoides TaxID=1405 RepID=A0AAP7WEV9_BACMY|nr:MULTISPECIES: hypothetical protein [Bacillus]EJS07398.1 hypothetical protein IKO_02304 [Bacillus cereus VDM034]MCQ6355591.1 hypothetical protein [Bacillus cereus]OSX96708.1 hypothetical protein S3E15_00339 [Bacillus mycoides]PRD11643.1 hypothetical protein CQ058_03680 [Bacillus sp. MYb56]QWI22489.1 hypothetical protein EXW34_14540 [Bacillus mycoides]
MTKINNNIDNQKAQLMATYKRILEKEGREFDEKEFEVLLTLNGLHEEPRKKTVIHGLVVARDLNSN